jgi:hypothetical protein
MLMIAFSLILAPTTHADGLFYKLYFVGLWEGIDHNDGSEAQRSITLNRDGTFNIIGQEPYTMGCQGARGMITGTGLLVDGVIISDDFTLTCFNGYGPFIMQATYKPDKLNGTLIEEIPDSDIDPTNFHKISKR